jgi:hypothetical protein
LDVYLSNQGGKAKAVMECALLSPGKPQAFAERMAASAGEGCSQLQTIAGKDYTYVLEAPGPKPSPDAVLQAYALTHTSHHAPAKARTRVIGDGTGDRVEVTVPFSRHRARRDLQDFGATVWARWSTDPTPMRTFRVTVTGLHVFNNLDGDIGEDKSDPSVDAPGEWNMYADMAGQWHNLSQEVPGLAKVPSGGADLDVSRTSQAIVSLPADADLRMFVDARECDLPGYKDCPADELDFGQFPGRAELRMPVSQLAGAVTTVTLHPPVCLVDTACPEEMSKPSQCPQGCWQMTFKIEDMTDAGASVVRLYSGDGTADGTLVDGLLGRTVTGWLEPITRYGPDQGEENDQISTLVRDLKSRR